MRTLSFAVAVLLACLAGCVPMERTSTIDQKQRENVGQKAGSEFIQSAKPEPLSVTIPTKDGQIHITQPTASFTKAHASVSESSDSMATGSSEWSESIPLFAKLIGLAIGLGLLAGVVFWIIRTVRQNPAVDAAWTGASDILTRKIEALKAARDAATDANAKAAFQASINHLHEANAETLT